MKHNETLGNEALAQTSSVARRQFMKGMGVSAALAVTGFPSHAETAKGTAQPTTGQPTTAPGPLRNSPMVMIWRRVSSLPTSHSFVNRVLQLPAVGKDPISSMYDGGGALLGFAVQEVQASNEPVVAACSVVSFQDFYLQNNPASATVLSPVDFKTSTAKLYADRASVTPPEKLETGECVRFLDDDGNTYCFYKPSRKALLEYPSSEKLGSLLKNRWPSTGAQLVDVAFDGDRKAGGISNPVIGHELLVTDLPQSTRYYSNVLGLKLLEGSAVESKFDAGTMMLTLRQEPTNMLVAFLRKSGRLLGDWLVFHTESIKQTSAALQANGVAFPAGIENSVIGDVAYFNDPDGYSLTLWQPSGKTKMIDFNPPLKRILNEAREKSSAS
jgi:predicted enzyme related to lactoylglutathione lyase